MAAERFFLELEPPEERLRDAPHVVIVGGGFAGVRACKALAQADVRVTLIDKRNFNLFQPLLYQVATGLVAPGDVATPLRQLVGKQRNVQVLLGEVTGLDAKKQQIHFGDKALNYDHLVLATGSGSTYFGHEEWRTFAPPMKILEHAQEIRRRLLRAMPASLSASAQKTLESLGVETRFKGRVQSMQPGEVTIGTPDGEQTIQAATVIWTAGVRPSHLGKTLAGSIDCELDRGGRVVVEADFSVKDHPEIRVVGDLCSYKHTSTGNPLPGMAGPATQAGGFVGKDIAAIMSGSNRPNFKWFDFGSMAVLDRVAAVADLRGFKFSGSPGWAVWAAAHLAFMPDRENRWSLLIKWMFAVLSQQRSSMLLTGMPSQHIGLDSADAPFPMKSGSGPSIAAPDAALKAAMNYYANSVSGVSAQAGAEARDESATGSDAAIK